MEITWVSENYINQAWKPSLTALLNYRQKDFLINHDGLVWGKRGGKLIKFWISDLQERGPTEPDCRRDTDVFESALVLNIWRKKLSRTVILFSLLSLILVPFPFLLSYTFILRQVPSMYPTLFPPPSSYLFKQNMLNEEQPQGAADSDEFSILNNQGIILEPCHPELIWSSS